MRQRPAPDRATAPPATVGTGRARRLLRDLLLVLALGLAAALLRSASAGAAPGGDLLPPVPSPRAGADAPHLGPASHVVAGATAAVRPTTDRPGTDRQGAGSLAVPVARSAGARSLPASGPSPRPLVAPAPAFTLDLAPAAPSGPAPASTLAPAAPSIPHPAALPALAPVASGTGAGERPSFREALVPTGEPVPVVADVVTDVRALGDRVLGPVLEPIRPVLAPVAAAGRAALDPVLSPVLELAGPLGAALPAANPVSSVAASSGGPAGAAPGAGLPDLLPALGAGVSGAPTALTAELGPDPSPVRRTAVGETVPAPHRGGVAAGPAGAIPELVPVPPAPAPAGALPAVPGPGAPLGVLTLLESPAAAAAGLVPASSPDANSATCRRPGYSPD
ncbi:MAG TPA: hypothetical protein VEW93_09270 [Acidimicrobiales bacterium]|nr:hypothetical protein [Acidimicrobiales bacterium]